MLSGWVFTGICAVGSLMSFSMVRSGTESPQAAVVVSLAAMVCGLIGIALHIQEQINSSDSSFVAPVIGVLVFMVSFGPLNWALKAAGAPIIVVP